jgi:hypothetical protein
VVDDRVAGHERVAGQEDVVVVGVDDLVVRRVVRVRRVRAGALDVELVALVRVAADRVRPDRDVDALREELRYCRGAVGHRLALDEGVARNRDLVRRRIHGRGVERLQQRRLGRNRSGAGPNEPDPQRVDLRRVGDDVRRVGVV